MTTLTDRYIHATLRSVPEARREEIGRELRSSIEDMVEARAAAGERTDAAERAVLTDLGDPGALAADYSDRPLHLIGPRYFLTYWRLLITLLTWIPAVVGAIVLVVSMLESPHAGAAIGDTVTAVIMTALHIFFWTTLVFAVIERVERDPELPEWSVDSLPEVQDARQMTLADSAASIVFIVLIGAVLVLQHFRTWTPGPDGADVAVLDPALWSGWIPFLLAVLVVNLGVEVWKYRVGRWTWPVAGALIAVSVAFSLPVAWLASQDALLNPEFIDTVGMSATLLDNLNRGILAGTIIVLLIEVTDAVTKTRQANRALIAA